MHYTEIVKKSYIELLEVELSGRDETASWHHVITRVHADEGIKGLREVGMVRGTRSPAADPRIITDEGSGEDLGFVAGTILVLHSFTSMLGALQVAEAVAALDILCIQVPTRNNGTAAHERASAKASASIAESERQYAGWHCLPYLRTGSSELEQPDVGLVGAISETFKTGDPRRSAPCSGNRSHLTARIHGLPSSDTDVAHRRTLARVHAGHGGRGPAQHRQPSLGARSDHPDPLAMKGPA